MPRRRQPTTLFPVTTVLHASIQVIRERGGFVSVKDATAQNVTPTSHYVLQKLKNGFDPGLASDNDKILVGETIAAFKNALSLKPNDEFLPKVKEILNIGSVTSRNIGYIVCLPHLYELRKNRVNKLKTISEKYVNSKFIGEKGKRSEFLIKIIKLSSPVIPDQNNTVTYQFADKEGNYGFFYSNETDCPLQLWDCALIKATVVDHSVRSTGMKQTQLGRIRVIQNIGKGTEEDFEG